MWRVRERGEAYKGFWWGNLTEKDHLGDPGVDRKIILRRISRKWDVACMDWIELPQDRERWRGIVNAVMNVQVTQNLGNFLIN